MKYRVFTSESVTEGHPDKVCDAVSDAVLDAYLAGDPKSHVACECIAANGMILITGEITSNAQVDVPSVARKTICEIGYTSPELGFDGNSCAVLTAISKQSPDIAQGIERDGDYDHVGAGDQGMMFGFACDETPQLMPLPISLAHAMAKQLTKLRREGTLSYLRPDGKTQVSVAYDGDKPVFVDTVVISTQHSEDAAWEQIHDDMIEHVVKPIIPAHLLTEETKYYINPTGRFVIGGPAGDSGLTGRKIIVDTYGGYAAHGGGAFSGKDPTKVDRSGTYMARYIAKNLVASGLCRKCEVQISYAIGVAKPVSVHVNSYATGKVSDVALSEIVYKVFDMRPAAMIENLSLRTPMYRNTTNYGHFGREDCGFAWEKTDKADALREAARSYLA